MTDNETINGNDQRRDAARDAAWRKWAPAYVKILEAGDAGHPNYEDAVTTMVGFSKGFNLCYDAGRTATAEVLETAIERVKAMDTEDSLGYQIAQAEVVAILEEENSNVTG